MNITVGMTAYNCLNYSKLTIDSILNHTKGIDYNLVVVDNASTDGSKEYFESLLPKIPYYRYIRYDTNRWCSGAWNGLMNAGKNSDYTIILNNDIVVTDSWLKNLVDFMEKHPEAGTCSCHVLDMYNEQTRLKLFGDPKTGNTFISKDWIEYAEAIADEEKDIVDEGLQGCSFAIRKDASTKIGKFDERYEIASYEDVDWVLQNEKAGLKVLTTHSSIVFHWGGTTQAYMSQHLGGSSFQGRNRMRFSQKWKVNLSGYICNCSIMKRDLGNGKHEKLKVDFKNLGF